MAMKAEEVPQVPIDSFAVRLAIIRAALGGLNISAAAAQCGLDDENWRRWEKGQLPRDQGAVARKVAAATGFDYVWIMAGGPLRPEGVTARSSGNSLLRAVHLGNEQLELGFPDPGAPRTPLTAVATTHRHRSRSVIWTADPGARVRSLTG